MNPNIPHNHEGHRERLRKRFLTSADAMSEQELLELTLTFSIPRKDVSLIAADLLRRYKSLDAILCAPIEELARFPGIGESTALLFKVMDTIKMKKSHVQQRTLFQATDDLSQAAESPKLPKSPKMHIFANDEIANTLQLLPKAPYLADLDGLKGFLMSTLPYNSVETRNRRADYILSRFFPTGTLHTPLTLYLSHEPQERALKPVIFYHVLKSEPLAVKVADELIYPLLPIGRTDRQQIKEFVLKYLPEASASSLKNAQRAVFNAYGLLGVGSAAGEILRFQLREGLFEPFLYIFSAEFPEPGMYTFDQLHQSALHRWLLWDREWLRRQLYALRDLGIVSKVSEIDSVRQFTVALDQTEALQKYYS